MQISIFCMKISIFCMKISDLLYKFFLLIFFMIFSSIIKSLTTNLQFLQGVWKLAGCVAIF